MPATFENVVHPLSVSEFFRKHYGKQWILLQDRDADSNDSFLSIAQLDDFFARSRLQHPWVKLVKQGVEVPLTAYASPHFPASSGVVDNDKLFEHLRDGASLIVNSLDRHIPSLGMICRQMEKELGLRVWSNVYIVNPGSRGFGIHQDIQDIFILELSGVRNWAIYPFDEDNRGPRQPGPGDIPEREFQLKPGDVLYLPKNQPHMASASNQPTIHLSLTIEGYYWIDMLKELVDLAEHDREFSKRLPIPIQGEEAAGAFIEEFQNKMTRFLSANGAESLVNRLHRKQRQDQAAQAPNLLHDFLGETELSMNTKLIMRPHVAFDYRVNNGFVSVELHGKQLNFPFFSEKLLQRMISGKMFTLNDIDESKSDNEKLFVARTLLRHGLLQIDR